MLLLPVHEILVHTASMSCNASLVQSHQSLHCSQTQTMKTGEGSDLNLDM